MKDNIGYITQVIGPVVDATFDGEGAQLPPIYNALKIQRPDGSDLIVEVEQHIGEQTVRCVAMDTTDGLTRGMKVVDLQRPLAMPTGNQVKGRLMNVMGNAFPLSTTKRSLRFIVLLLVLKIFPSIPRCFIPV